MFIWIIVDLLGDKDSCASEKRRCPLRRLVVGNLGICTSARLESRGRNEEWIYRSRKVKSVEQEKGRMMLRSFITDLFLYIVLYFKTAAVTTPLGEQCLLRLQCFYLRTEERRSLAPNRC